MVCVRQGDRDWHGNSMFWVMWVGSELFRGGDGGALAACVTCAHLSRSTW